MAVSFGPIASGLPPGLVDKLVQLERKPIIKLEQRKAKVQEKMKLLQELKGHVSSIDDFTKKLGKMSHFRELTTASDEPKILTATADKEIAKPGQFDIEVIQLARKPSAISNGFPDQDETQVGVGFFSFELPNGEEKEVYVGPDNNTLTQLARLINIENIGVTAQVIECALIGNMNDRNLPGFQTRQHPGKAVLKTSIYSVSLQRT